MSGQDLNKQLLIGRLGKDPEISVAQSGIKIAKFSLATNRKYKEQEEVTWFNITCFDKLAEIVGQYCHKGNRVYVEGETRKRTYTKQDGSTGYAEEVIADKVLFMESKRDAEQSQQSNLPGTGSGGVTDDDIPF